MTWGTPIGRFGPRDRELLRGTSVTQRLRGYSDDAPILKLKLPLHDAKLSDTSWLAKVRRYIMCRLLTWGLQFRVIVAMLVKILQMNYRYCHEALKSRIRAKQFLRFRALSYSTPYQSCIFTLICAVQARIDFGMDPSTHAPKSSRRSKDALPAQSDSSSGRGGTQYLLAIWLLFRLQPQMQSYHLQKHLKAQLFSRPWNSKITPLFAHTGMSTSIGAKEHSGVTLRVMS